MTVIEIKHGTLRGYVIDKCRCALCRRANADYNNRANRLRAYGQWHPYVDAQPARDHLALLADFGIGWMRATRLAGVSHGTVSKLLYGMPGRPPSKRIRPETEAKILAVRPALENLADSARTDGTGARRRLRALMVRGFPAGLLAERLGIQVTNFSKVLRADGLIEAATVRRIHALYEELWNADPAACGVTPRARAYAANVAVKHGWWPPMAWDDRIDDPGFTPEPEPTEATPRPLVVAEEAEFLTSMGVSRHSIAEQLGLKDVGSLERTLARAKELEAAR